MYKNFTIRILSRYKSINHDETNGVQIIFEIKLIEYLKIC
jgi:hypothetical protein